MRALWWVGLLFSAVAQADQTPAPAPAVEDPEPVEIIVLGDRFARWDHTRWYSEMQIGFPIPFPLYARQNWETRLVALQIRAAFKCEKTWRRGNRQFEVNCDIEDLSLRGVAYEDGSEHATDILQELDQLLTDSTLRLYVTDNGRIDNIDLEGFPANNRRENVIREAARQLMRRLMAGFHMKLPRSSAMTEGQWVEYDSPVFLLPTPVFWSETEASAPPSAGLTSMGGTYLLHQLDKYRGKLVVQSKGQGTVSDGHEDSEAENFYGISYDGVSIYDPQSGIMTERVYALHGQATASSPIADGFGGSLYFHAGRIQMLSPTDKVRVGFTGRVIPDAWAAQHPELPRWKVIQ